MVNLIWSKHSKQLVMRVQLVQYSPGKHAELSEVPKTDLQVWSYDLLIPAKVMTKQVDPWNLLSFTCLAQFQGVPSFK